MTFQSTPVSSLKNAVCASTTPSTTMAAAPHSAAATRWIRSVAISTYAATKAAMTSDAVNASTWRQQVNKECADGDGTEELAGSRRPR